LLTRVEVLKTLQFENYEEDLISNSIEGVGLTKCSINSYHIMLLFVGKLALQENVVSHTKNHDSIKAHYDVCLGKS
jgi:hypothetical protein